VLPDPSTTNAYVGQVYAVNDDLTALAGLGPLVTVLGLATNVIDGNRQTLFASLDLLDLQTSGGLFLHLVGALLQKVDEGGLATVIHSLSLSHTHTNTQTQIRLSARRYQD
jgi:hypothetical protein